MPAQWFTEQLQNRNLLSPIGFQLKLDRFRGVDFFCQRANLPDIQMPVTEVPTRFRTYPVVPGGGVTYSDLVVTFLIDEEMINYKTIHNWIRDNGNADQMETTEDYPSYSNGQLHILTSNFNTNHIIDYESIFPYSLTPVNFDARDTSSEYFTAEVAFKFQNYTIRDKDFKV